MIFTLRFIGNKFVGYLILYQQLNNFNRVIG